MNNEIIYKHSCSLLPLLAWLCSFFLALFIQENRNDLLNQEVTELMPIPSTSQENSNVAAVFISTENIDGDVANPDEGNCNDFLDQESMEQLSMPSTSQGISNAAAILTSAENIDYEDDNEADSFTTQKLFSFAWQIAKGMVGINIAHSI